MHARATVSANQPSFATASTSKCQDRVQVVSDWSNPRKMQDPGLGVGLIEKKVGTSVLGCSSQRWGQIELDKVATPVCIHVEWTIVWVS